VDDLAGHRPAAREREGAVRRRVDHDVELAAVARLTAADPAELTPAGRVAAVARRRVAVVAGFVAANQAVAADRGAGARLTAARPAALDLAGRAAAVARRRAAVVAGLRAADQAVAADRVADARRAA